MTQQLTMCTVITKILTYDFTKIVCVLRKFKREIMVTMENNFHLLWEISRQYQNEWFVTSITN